MITATSIVFAIMKGVFVYVAGAVVAIFFWLLGRMVGIGFHPVIRWSLGAFAAAGCAYFLYWSALIPIEAGPEQDLALRERIAGRATSVLAISALFATGVVATLFHRMGTSRRSKGPLPGRN